MESKSKGEIKKERGWRSFFIGRFFNYYLLICFVCVFFRSLDFRLVK